MSLILYVSNDMQHEIEVKKTKKTWGNNNLFVNIICRDLDDLLTCCAILFGRNHYQQVQKIP